MRTEKFTIEVSSTGSRKETFNPNLNGRILGVMVSPKYQDNTDISLSMQKNNTGKQLIDPMSISHLADRNVEWGKNFFPLNIESQKIDVYAVYLGESTPFTEDVDLIFIFEDEEIC